MKTLQKTTACALAGAVLAAGSVTAQISGDELRDMASAGQAKDALMPGQDGMLDLEIVLAEGSIDFGGLQFQIHYDERIRGVQVESCLAGIPETHVGAFTSCDVLPDRNEIRVVITDLGKNRRIPAGLLGVIQLSATGPVPADAIAIKGFQSLDTKGESMIRPDGSEFIRLRQIR